MVKIEMYSDDTVYVNDEGGSTPGYAKIVVLVNGAEVVLEADPGREEVRVPGGEVLSVEYV